MKIDGTVACGTSSFPPEDEASVDPPASQNLLSLDQPNLRRESLPPQELAPHGLPGEETAAGFSETRQVSSAEGRDVGRSAAYDARPRRPLTRDQVRSVLQEMGRNDAAEKVSNLDIDHGTLYRPVEGFYTRIDDPRISSGVSTEDSRQVLASYYGRKYGASIKVHACDVNEFCSELADLIQTERRKPDDVVRSAHCFGYGHGRACIYIREHRREALLVFDSWPGATTTGSLLAQAMREARNLRGRPIEVFEHHAALQHANYSCWTQAMKAAVTVTRRSMDESGELSDRFLIENLIEELQARRVDAPSPEGVIHVRAIPELAKMAQHPDLIAAHAGDDDARAKLRDSKLFETLVEFVGRHTVNGVVNQSGRTLEVMDYARRKSDRYAEIAVIGAWDQLLLEELGPERWTAKDQTDFFKSARARMKEEAQRPVAPS